MTSAIKNPSIEFPLLPAEDRDEFGWMRRHNARVQARIDRGLEAKVKASQEEKARQAATVVAPAPPQIGTDQYEHGDP